MDDEFKPRRPRSEERAEINRRLAEADDEARFLQELRRPPGQSLLLQSEQERMEEEVELREQENFETAGERYESERILRAEEEMIADIPFRREREFLKTFPGERLRQAAAARG